MILMRLGKENDANDHRDQFTGGVEARRGAPGEAGAPQRIKSDQLRVGGLSAQGGRLAGERPGGGRGPARGALTRRNCRESESSLLLLTPLSVPAVLSSPASDGPDRYPRGAKEHPWQDESEK